MATIHEDDRLGFALGAAEFVTKPINRSALLAALERHAVKGSGATVLVVEDDEPTRVLLRRTLERAGWDVTPVENGRVGLERLAEVTPAVVLLDLMMPEMDGFEFLESLRANAAWRDLPVIVITAKVLTDADRKRLNGGVQSVLQKGGRSSESLLDEVRKLVAPHKSTVAAN